MKGTENAPNGRASLPENLLPATSQTPYPADMNEFFQQDGGVPNQGRLAADGGQSGARSS